MSCHLSLSPPQTTRQALPSIALPTPYTLPTYIQHSLQLQPKRYPSISPVTGITTSGKQYDLHTSWATSRHTQAGHQGNSHIPTNSKPIATGIIHRLQRGRALCLHEQFVSLFRTVKANGSGGTRTASVCPTCAWHLHHPTYARFSAGSDHRPAAEHSTRAPVSQVSRPPHIESSLDYRQIR